MKNKKCIDLFRNIILFDRLHKTIPFIKALFFTGYQIKTGNCKIKFTIPRFSIDVRKTQVTQWQPTSSDLLWLHPFWGLLPSVPRLCAMR